MPDLVFAVAIYTLYLDTVRRVLFLDAVYTALPAKRVFTKVTWLSMTGQEKSAVDDIIVAHPDK